MTELTYFANLCGTDKGTENGECHSYTEFYDNYFKKFKDKPVNILEIGVFDGASLKMYKEYFGNDCKIYGLDILDMSIHNDDNISTYIIDQGSREQLENFKKSIGDIKFDIIVDDGSHIPEHQQLTLYYFNDLLKEDGIYILEDLHTFVWDKIENSPLYSLVFNKPFRYLTAVENDILKANIKTATTWNHYNELSPFCKSSITSILTFNK